MHNSKNAQFQCKQCECAHMHSLHATVFLKLNRTTEPSKSASKPSSAIHHLLDCSKCSCSVWCQKHRLSSVAFQMRMESAMSADCMWFFHKCLPNCQACSMPLCSFVQAHDESKPLNTQLPKSPDCLCIHLDLNDQGMRWCFHLLAWHIVMHCNITPECFLVFSLQNLSDNSD